MKEYKGKYELLKRKNEEKGILPSYEHLESLINIILKLFKSYKTDEFKHDMLNKIVKDKSLETKQELLSMIDTIKEMTEMDSIELESKIIRLDMENQVLRDSNKSLSTQCEVLYESISSLQRKIGRLAKDNIHNQQDDLQPSNLEDHHTTTIAAEGSLLHRANQDESFSLINREREQSYQRLNEELMIERGDKMYYKSNYIKLKELNRRIPIDLMNDPRSYEAISRENKNLYYQISSLRKQQDKLFFDLESWNSQFENFFRKLEQLLDKFKYDISSINDFIHGDLSRLRKERDQIKIKYESLANQNRSTEEKLRNLLFLYDTLEDNYERTKMIRTNTSTDEQILLQEMESLIKAFEQIKLENKKLIENLHEKEEKISSLVSEKLTADFSLNQLQKAQELEKDVNIKIRNESQKLIDECNNVIAKYMNEFEKIKKEQQERILQQQEKIISLKEAEMLYHQMKEKYHILTEKIDINSLAEKEITIEKLKEQTKSLENKIVNLTKTSEDVKLTTGSDAYKELLKCNTCHVRQKDCILIKCMHTFCRECIERRLETRQRKCPNCGESFGANDIKAFYL